MSDAEIHFLAKRSRTTPFDILRRFKDAGLDSLSGDSADILNDKVRKKIASLSRNVPLGSPEWDILYRKYYEEESRKSRSTGG